jgi:hypothetical protein
LRKLIRIFRAVVGEKKRHQSGQSEGAAGWFGLAIVALQLALVAVAAHFFRIEEGRGFVGEGGKLFGGGANLMGMALVAFVIHAFLPLRYRLPFFLAFSMAAFLAIMGWYHGAILLGIGLGLVGLCHLPVPHWYRVAAVALAALVLGLFRRGIIDSGWAATVLPVLGSIFMFRLIVYLYHLRHERVPVSGWQRLSYFFLAPNVCFPLFPVVDYSTYLRTYYDDRELRIYQKGVHWMARGLIHLLLYRLVYYYWSPAPADVTELSGVVQFVISAYLLYLRISGQFHLIIGMMGLFGFNLPETHHRYLLATGFTDYWRRINIYWKDFMLKLVFYPCFVKFKKLGHTWAIVLATVVVFTGTWFLHGYQWFWLRGAFHFSVVDALFWGIFGVLVIVNSLYELRRPNSAPAKPGAFSLGKAVRISLQVGAMFVLMCVLWAFWQSNTIGEYFGVLKQAGNASGSQLLLLAACALAAVSVGVLAQWIESRGWVFWRTEGRGVPLWRPACATAIPMLALCILGAEPVSRALETRGFDVVVSMKGGRLNERDRHALERGYYEGLLQRETFASELWEVRLEQRPDWQPLQQSKIFRMRPDLLEKELVPNFETEIAGVPWKTNRWGMRDRDYPLDKPEGAYRIAAIGASYVSGDGIPDDELFLTRVEDWINALPAEKKGFGEYEILNMAVPGYTLIEFLIVTELRIAKFKPDAMYLIAHTNPGGRTMGGILRRMEENVPLTYDFLEGLRERAGIPERDPGSDELRRMRKFKHELVDWAYARMVKICEAHDIKPVWVYLPVTDEVIKPDEIEAHRQVAERAGFYTIVLDDAYRTDDPSQLWISKTNHHPTAEGHRRVALTMFEKILENAAGLGLELRDADGEAEKYQRSDAAR